MRFEQWKPLNTERGWIPAFMSGASDKIGVVTNMNDIGTETTKELCEAECARRNAAQLERAQNAVAKAERELEIARSNLAKIVALLD